MSGEIRLLGFDPAVLTDADRKTIYSDDSLGDEGFLKPKFGEIVNDYQITCRCCKDVRLFASTAILPKCIFRSHCNTCSQYRLNNLKKVDLGYPEKRSTFKEFTL